MKGAVNLGSGKISIIIPCYNAQKYIKECFQSLVRQSIGIGNLEIIFVDDASTDNTGSLIKEMEQQYPSSVRAIYLPKNRKQGGARNQGIAIATGEYLAFLDADDWAAPDLYKQLYETANQYQTDIIQYPMLKYYGGVTQLEDPAQLKGFIVLEDIEMRKLFLMGQALTCGSQTKFYKKSFLDSVGVQFLEGCAYEEPSFVYPQLFYAKRVYCTSEPMYYYRMHEQSTMHQYVRLPGKLYDHARVQEYVLQDMKRRLDIWEIYHEEIVYYFILTYFIETLYFAGSCGLQFSVEEFRQIRETVRKEAPEYKMNRYLLREGFEYKRFLPYLEKELTQGGLHDLCKEICLACSGTLR